MKDETFVTHQKPARLDPENEPLTAPIHQSVKYVMPSLEALEELFEGKREGYYYSRHANPTVRQLAEQVAKLQGCEDALCTNTGLSAIATCLMALLRQGDHMVMFLESYRPARYLVRRILGRFGVTHSMLSIHEHEEIEKAFAKPETKLVLFESPTNPLTKIADIPFIVEAAKRHGVTTILDNTFAGFHNHGSYPIDIFVHSLTKYAAGHGDAMGGVIIGSKEAIRRLRPHYVTVGSSLDPFSAFLIMRGMKTFFLRYERQCRNALAVAEFLEQHSRITRVIYPGLPSHPDYVRAREQMKDSGGIVCFDIDGGDSQVRRFINELKIFQLAASLGSTESLATPALSFFAEDLRGDDLAKSSVRESTLRLSIGIEAVEDLTGDLNQALAAAV